MHQMIFLSSYLEQNLPSKHRMYGPNPGEKKSLKAEAWDRIL